jgi:MinD-like ATPase involved in chromosome partitioning or flagellar assembly
MTALTVGITTAKEPECKRGLAVNMAASLARHSALSDRVCVVDADPFVRDVSTRMPVSGPALEDFARTPEVNLSRLGRYHAEVAVLPNRGEPIARTRLAVEHSAAPLREHFDVVVYDVPGGPTGPGRAVGGRLERLDWLVLAITPEPAAIAPAAHFVEMFETARTRGEIGEVRLAVVCTGDESSAVFEPTEIEAILGVTTAGRVPQLWGRAAPNVGFGPALAIPELDDAIYDMLMAFRLGRDHRPELARL